MKNLLFLAFFTLLALFSCKKENFETFKPNPTGLEEKIVTASFSGLVVDEHENGLAATQIKIGGNVTQTDENGVFFFEKIVVTNTKAYFQANKNGYFHGSRTLFVQAGKNHQVRIKMLPNTPIGSFSNAAGGTITIPDGGSLSFDAADVALPNGSPYTGMVNVAVKRIDPTTTNGRFEMPGDLRGINAAKNQVVLQSFGMLAVELTDMSGNLLQVAPNQTVDMAFKLPVSLLADAPTTIPLWYFDEATGDWREEGSATLSGNTYQGKVSHFSFWNYDADFETVMFEAIFLDESGGFLSNQQIAITLDNWTTFGTTNEDGWVGGLVKANADMKLSIYTDCGLIFIQDFTTTLEDINLGSLTVTIDDQTNLTVSGTLVNCDNFPVENGYLQVRHNDWFNYNSYQVNSENNFSFNHISCSTIDSIKLKGIDLVSLNQSDWQVFDLNTSSDLGTIVACDTPSEEYFTVTLPHPFKPEEDTTMTYFPPYINFYLLNDSIDFQLYIIASSNFYFKYINLVKYGTATPATYDNVWGFIQLNDIQHYFKSSVKINQFPTNIGDYAEGTIESDGNEPIVTGSFRIKRLE